MARKKYDEHITPGVEPPGVEPGAGLTCARCGCRHFLVVYTRKASGGRILRRRECRHCGNRLTTIEEERKE